MGEAPDRLLLAGGRLRREGWFPPSIKRVRSSWVQPLHASNEVVLQSRTRGRFTSESNAAFDAWLKERGAHQGIRDFEAVDALARQAGLTLVEDRAMPSNNRCLVWRGSMRAQTGAHGSRAEARPTGRQKAPGRK